MKARFIKHVKKPNPLFNQAEWAQCQRMGEVYPIPHDVVIEPGLVVEHPRAWRACMPGFLNAEPVAEPADESCRLRVEFEMAKFRQRRDAIPDTLLYRVPDNWEAAERLMNVAIAYDRYHGEFD